MTGTLLKALADHAHSAPDRCALAVPGRRVGYGQLFDEARGVAAGLQRRGIGSGDRVAVHGEKSIASVTAILGVLLSGAAYVPLDPAAPPARRRSLVEDAGAAAVLTARPKADQLAAELGSVRAPVPVLAVEDQTSLDGWRDVTVGPDDLAYVLYTSGSTGRPKGVCIPHRALDAFFGAVSGLLDLGPEAVCLNTSALHFDVSVVDLLLPLVHGATVHLGPAVPLPGVLLDLIERERVTHMAAVGSTLTLLAQHGNGLTGRELGSLRRIMTGAEVLNPATVQAWLAAAENVEVVNGYGPTEATCLVVAEPIARREPGRTEPYPIGRPLPGVRIAFRAPDGTVTADGPGEILVSGAQVMTGYLNRPEEERAAFQEVEGTRYYRTGDLGHLRPDGVIAFAGRADDEVKVRGYRINLNEVRGAVESHPAVAQAFAAASPDERDGLALVCAVRLRTEGGATDADLVAHVAGMLPRYMVPRDFVFVPEFPALSSGKPDTVRLRELVGAR
ncbi:amino acid adenylation domain-containing protein [Kitasatospora atroaurantiaca]|uniref:Amino acid adenylation domain-containing protein n=1 Tax=Kitasatospora atroaurantiaca TaxID=285545 RepID=A0A561ET60_9ACTN|nr:amino acid adenylation domain-containing protein [Kitasatospora atroaurantiaca]TWE18804.1 amino acid adenylation domain-containing protein [Kitasatospora atroaurantiaca]